MAARVVHAAGVAAAWVLDLLLDLAELVAELAAPLEADEAEPSDPFLEL